MELAPHQQLFNLGQFINNRLKPAGDAFEEVVSAPQASGSEIERIAARGEFREALWWLLLGVELGYFPTEGARLLLANYRPLILREHERYIELESNLFSTLLTEWSEKARLSSGPLSPLYAFDAPAELLPDYQTALLISQSLAADPVAGACMRAVTFLSDGMWLQMQSLEVLSERVYGLLTGRTHSRLESDKNLLIAGAIQALSHMEAYKQFFEDFDLGRAGNPTDRDRFRFRVGELQVWRLDLSKRATESRFNQIIDAATALVGSELEHSAHVRNDAKNFHDVAFTLTESWKRNIRAWSPAQA